jgi:hypothetical protein
MPCGGHGVTEKGLKRPKKADQQQKRKPSTRYFGFSAVFQLEVEEKSFKNHPPERRLLHHQFFKF